jgi:hypothetical protein
VLTTQQVQACLAGEQQSAYLRDLSPVHCKVQILESIPRLSKISMSPWGDLEEAVEAVGDRFVFSRKPNPAALAQNHWSAEQVRQDLRTTLMKARGCVLEIILKYVSMVRYEPQRVWQWPEVATEVAQHIHDRR